jgi:hypothetical protein
VKNFTYLNHYRVPVKGDWGDQKSGAFVFPSPTDPTTVVRVIASCEEGWDHVSASCPHRCPTWEEMEFVKRQFFFPEECAMQLHVPEAEHINCHPFCLHIWRPHGTKIPRPPAWMVGADPRRM